MTVIFSHGPHKQLPAAGSERQYIEEVLRTCGNPSSYIHWLNTHFNCPAHFGSCPYRYDARRLLECLQRVACSEAHNVKVQVMGTIHTDPGHVSQVMGGALVRDYYIRVRVLAPPALIGRMEVTPGRIYHVLVASPEVLALPTQAPVKDGFGQTLETGYAVGVTAKGG